MKKILIVEDEKAINNLIKINLVNVGFECKQAFTGLQALNSIMVASFDVIILDVKLPGVNGFDVMERLKENVPVLFLTAKNNIDDKMKAFRMGAEDYLTKPFEILELLARVHVILRRNQEEDNLFHIDHITVDLNAHKVYDQNTLVDLTPQEYDLLETLILNQNLALTREKLLELAWDISYEGDIRTVDVHIQKLRKKLRLEDRIKTVYKLGYRLEV